MVPLKMLLDPDVVKYPEYVPLNMLLDPEVLEYPDPTPIKTLLSVDVPALISIETLPMTSRRVIIGADVAELRISKRESGVDVPIPTFPLVRIFP